MSEKNSEILEQLKSLKLGETGELVKQIEKTFNVDATPRINMNFSFTNNPVIPDEPEIQTEFDVILELVPADKKIAILKVVRNLTGLGLKEAKYFVDSAPKNVKSGIAIAEAEELKKELELAGAKVAIK